MCTRIGTCGSELYERLHDHRREGTDEPRWASCGISMSDASAVSDRLAPDTPDGERRRGPEGGAMSVVVDAAHLRQEMARRGWDAVQLAREARLSPATISAALGGRPIAARSLALIANALIHAPVIGVIDSLIATDTPLRGLD